MTEILDSSDEVLLEHKAKNIFCAHIPDDIDEFSRSLIGKSGGVKIHDWQNRLTSDTEQYLRAMVYND